MLTLLSLRVGVCVCVGVHAGVCVGCVAQTCMCTRLMCMCGYGVDVCVWIYVYVCVVCNGLGAAGCRHDGLTAAGGKLLGVKGDEAGGQGAWCGGLKGGGKGRGRCGREYVCGGV